MASDYERAKQHVQVEAQIRRLVQAAVDAARRPCGTWSEERVRAIAELRQLMQSVGEELVLAVLFDGFADMVFLEANRLEYRANRARATARRHYADELAQAWHDARLRKLANC